MKNLFSLLPNFETANDETDKSDKTDAILISNADFMAGVFGNVTGAERPVVVSLAGNPSNGAWFAKPWIMEQTCLSADHNNYISFATFRPDDNGEYQRQKKYFAALYAVMLDDIGVKVPQDRISLAPSWIIETSKGNYQYGYMLSEPLRDAAEADRLFTAIIDAELTDPGASGPCVRLGRLPVAINGKHTDDRGEAWRCKPACWQPKRRYSVQEIVDGLQIKLKETSQQRREPSRTGSVATDHSQYDDVHIPRADEHPVIAALKAAW